MSSKGVNKVIIVGNLGQDPETRFMPSGSSVTNITVATSETWNDKQSGEKKERTEWHRVCFFNKLSEIAGKYLTKGSKVYIEGSLRTRKWQAQDGSDRYSTEIIASELQMLDSRQSDQPSRPQQQQPGYQNQPNPTYSQRTQPAKHQQAQQKPSGAYDGSSDDDFLPF